MTARVGVSVVCHGQPLKDAAGEPTDIRSHEGDPVVVYEALVVPAGAVSDARALVEEYLSNHPETHDSDPLPPEILSAAVADSNQWLKQNRSAKRRGANGRQLRTVGEIRAAGHSDGTYAHHYLQCESCGEAARIRADDLEKILALAATRTESDGLCVPFAGIKRMVGRIG